MHIFVSFTVFNYYFHCISFTIRLSGRKVAIKLIDSQLAQYRSPKQLSDLWYAIYANIMKLLAPNKAIIKPGVTDACKNCDICESGSPFRDSTCSKKRYKQLSGLCKLLVVVQLVKLSVFYYNMYMTQTKMPFNPVPSPFWICQGCCFANLWGLVISDLCTCSHQTINL